MKVITKDTYSCSDGLPYIFYGNIISSDLKCFQIHWYKAFNAITYESKPVCEDQEFEDYENFDKIKIISNK